MVPLVGNEQVAEKTKDSKGDNWKQTREHINLPPSQSLLDVYISVVIT